GDRIRLVYSGWNLGIPDGFMITAIPKGFLYDIVDTVLITSTPTFSGTFIVDFQKPRPAPQPTKKIAQCTTFVDVLLSSHLLYDGTNGFETNRQSNIIIADSSDA